MTGLGEDVLVDVVSFLEPPDILQLAQVSTNPKINQ